MRQNCFSFVASRRWRRKKKFFIRRKRRRRRVKTKTNTHKHIIAACNIAFSTIIVKVYGKKSLLKTERGK